jgi:phosphoribosylglycinamide formyltransferase-1
VIASETERFIGADLISVTATSDTARMAVGEPGLPREFRWGDQTVTIVDVRRSWHDTGPCDHGSRERYVRKHWYEVETAEHGIMKIYFDRQPPHGRSKGSRWRLFSMVAPAP